MQPEQPPLPPPPVQPEEPTPFVPSDPFAKDKPAGAVLPPVSAHKRYTSFYVLFFLIIVAAGGAYWYFHYYKKPQTTPTTVTSTSTTNASSSSASTAPPSNFTATIDDFITAMQNHDKKTADSLESVAFQAEVKKADGKSTSFYDVCQSGGIFCTGTFTHTYLDKAAIKTTDYAARDGTKGKQNTYTITVNNSSAGSKSTSTTTVIIAAVPGSNNKWLIDHIDEQGGVDATSSSQ